MKTIPEVRTEGQEYIARRLIDLNGELTIWGESILHAYLRVSKFSFVPPIGISRGSEILVLGSRIFNQLSEVTQNRTHLIMTVRDILRCKNIPRSLTYDLKSYRELYSYIINNDENAYAACRRRVEMILRKTQAKTLVANSTIDPINRLWLRVAREMGLRTVCVQHGVYSDAIPKYVLEEDIINRYIALDDSQKLILGKNIPVEKIVSLGAKDSFEWIPPTTPINICFVGEDWERYGFHKLKSMIIHKYIEILTYLKSHGYNNFYYKPHPSEREFLNIFNYTKLLKGEAKNVPDVYIGFSSSILKEMSSHRKLAIQIWDEDTGADNFQELGYCLSVANDHSLLDTILNEIKNSKKVPFICDAKLDDMLR